MLYVCVSAYQDAEWLAESLPALRVGVSGQDVRWLYVDGAYQDFLGAAQHASSGEDAALTRWLAQAPGPSLPASAQSTDGSQDIAREHGFTVLEGPADGWADECVKRSAYLLGQSGDWYFVVDADEVLEGMLPEVATLPGEAYQIMMTTEHPHSMCRQKPYPLAGRLFRHLPGMAYHGSHASVSVPDPTKPDGWRMLLNRKEWEEVGEEWPVIPPEQCWLRHRTKYRDVRRRHFLKAAYYQKLQVLEEGYRRRHGGG